MMVSNLTSLLLITLGLATLLGLIMGAALVRISSLRARKKQLQHHRAELSQQRDQLTDLEYRHGALQKSIVKDKQSFTSEINQHKLSSAQHDALLVHSRLQAKRIASLETNLSESEERGLRLQKDFDTYKLNKQRELEAVWRSNAQSGLNATQLHALDLPVLSKRVNPNTSDLALPAASVQAIQAMLEQELDIPIMAESEITGSVDDIDFESMLTADEIDPIG